MSPRNWRSTILAALSVFLFLAPCAVPGYARQQSPLPPTATAEEVRIYEAFRSWINSQPVEVQRADDDAVLQRYKAALEAGGKSRQEAASTVELLRQLGDRAEVERRARASCCRSR